MPIKGQVLAFIPSEPSAWEQFLAGLGMTEQHALEIAEGRAIGPLTHLREWARRNRRRRFIPEEVLAALGLAICEAECADGRGRPVGSRKQVAG